MRQALVCVVVSLLAVGSARAEEPAAQVVTVTKEALRGRVMLSVYTADESGARAAIDAALSRMSEVEARLADYVPTSDIVRVNQAAGRAPASISAESVAVLERGRELGRRVGGAWAMTSAVLQSLWDFRAAKPKKPEPVRLRERLDLVDDSQIQIDRGLNTVAIKNVGTTLGLDGLLVGYAADEAIAVLVRKGFGDALVFVGGDVRASGKKGNKPWVVGIQDPRAVGYFAVLPLENQAVATVGDYQRYVEIDGERYCDLLDPHTGMPARELRSATVVAADAATAHVLAAAVFVLGADAGLKLIEATPATHAVLVDAQNHVVISAQLKERLRVVRPPSE